MNNVITIHCGTDTLVFKPQDILYFEARKKYCFATTTSTQYRFEGSLDKLQNELEPLFVRIHRKYLINLDVLSSLVIIDGKAFVEIEGAGDNAILPVSRRELPVVRRRLNSR